jgi:hypothetical protein
MNHQLNIQFGFSVTNTGESRVPVEVINQKQARIWAQPVRLNRTATVSVPPGTYLIRAFLPNGDVLSEQADATKGDATVALRPNVQSPSESFGWAYYLQRPPRLRGRTERVDAWARIWTNGAARPFPPLSDWPESSDGVLRVTRLHEENAWIQTGGRSFLWKLTAAPPTKETQVAIARHEDDTHLRVIISLGNPDAQALLGFLTQGQLSAARTIGDDYLKEAEWLLSEKFADPIGAAVGGYFILAAGDLHRFHGHWSRNLAEQFSWLPDGGVIYAWHLLRQQTPDRDGARRELLRAANRGVPLFTRGLRLLYDGLTLFLDDDPVVRAALKRLAPYTLAADWNTGTTTFYGISPTEPREEPPTGFPPTHNYLAL